MEDLSSLEIFKNNNLNETKNSTEINSFKDLKIQNQSLSSKLELLNTENSHPITGNITKNIATSEKFNVNCNGIIFFLIGILGVLIFLGIVLKNKF